MKKQQENYGLELQNAHERWAYLYEHGGSDPFWEDGVNLNLVRNHILYYSGKIVETMSPGNYPAAFFKETPPEVDQQYMARKDEIRENAKKSLAIYKADPNYQYILRHQDDFSSKTKKRLCVDAVIGYATGLADAIEQDRLVDMRRHEHPETYLKSFEDCVRRMQETPPEEVQLSLFSFSAGGVDTPEDEDYDEDEGEEFGGMTMT